jgi:hypothetical protein
MGRNFSVLLNSHSAVVAMVQVEKQDLDGVLEIAKHQGVALVVVVVAERAVHVLAQCASLPTWTTTAALIGEGAVTRSNVLASSIADLADTVALAGSDLSFQAVLNAAAIAFMCDFVKRGCQGQHMYSVRPPMATKPILVLAKSPVAEAAFECWESGLTSSGVSLERVATTGRIVITSSGMAPPEGLQVPGLHVVCSPAGNGTYKDLFKGLSSNAAGTVLANGMAATWSLLGGMASLVEGKATLEDRAERNARSRRS